MKAEIDEINEQLTFALITKVTLIWNWSKEFLIWGEIYAIEEVNYEAEIEKILIGIGVCSWGFYASNIWVFRRLENANWISKNFCENQILILLDEPTNHMDIESIQWLEDFLINSAKAVVVISHDRAFVDNITNQNHRSNYGKDIWL
jgi:ATP-binding cassette subfamily F protein 3